MLGNLSEINGCIGLKVSLCHFLCVFLLIAKIIAFCGRQLATKKRLMKKLVYDFLANMKRITTRQSQAEVTDSNSPKTNVIRLVADHLNAFEHLTGHIKKNKENMLQSPNYKTKLLLHHLPSSYFTS